MIRAGLVCGGCGINCRNKPTTAEPLVVACPNCDEQLCDDCQNQGFFLVDDCPKQAIDLELYQATRLAGFLDSGLPPVAGGTLNQAAWFLDFAACLKSETGMAEAELIRGGAK
jgi:hypothetical protein